MAYNDCIARCSGIAEWIAFFDVDEFLVVKDAPDVNSWLNRYSRFDAVAVNWRYFGDSSLTSVGDDKSMVRRFTQASAKLDDHVKTIVNLQRPNCKMHICCHCTEKSLLAPSTVAVDGMTWCIGPKVQPPNNAVNIAYLAHFRCKTFQEYLKKSKRNNTGIMRDACIKDDMFEQFNKNDVEDLSLRDIMRRELNP